MTRVQVYSGIERRRRWSTERKRTIVSAAFSPGAVVSDVARRADVNTGQIYRWRDELSGADGFVGSSGFARVTVTADVSAVPSAPASMIEIAVGSEMHVRIPASAPPELAAAVGGRGDWGVEAVMIPVPSGVRVWLAVGRTDMRRGMNGLALQVQEALGRDPHAGDLYVFRGGRRDRTTLCILLLKSRAA